MTAKRIVPRALARRDVDEAVAYYLAEGGERVALGFIDALERRSRASAGIPPAGRLGTLTS